MTAIRSETGVRDPDRRCALDALPDGRRTAARAQLLDRYLGLVHHVAREIGARTPAVEVDELVSAGTIGLVRALDSFDLSRGLAFSTYAVRRIRGAILDDLRSRDWTPRSVRAKSRKLLAATPSCRAGSAARPSRERSRRRSASTSRPTGSGAARPRATSWSRSTAPHAGPPERALSRGDDRRSRSADSGQALARAEEIRASQQAIAAAGEGADGALALLLRRAQPPPDRRDPARDRVADLADPDPGAQALAQSPQRPARRLMSSPAAVGLRCCLW